MKNSTLYVGAALALQVVGVVAGILVVRVSSAAEYGLYSMAFGLVAAGTSISDAGIGSTIISQTASRPTDGRYLRLWLDVATRFRLRMGRYVEALCLLVMLGISIQQRIPWHVQLMTCVTIVALLESSFIRGVWVNYFRIFGKANEAQVIDLVWSVGRLVATAALLFIPGPKLFPLFVILVSANWGIALHMRRRAEAALGPRTNRAHGGRERRVMATAFKHVLPLNSVNVLRGQVLNVLVTALAGLSVLGQVTALSRYSLAYVVVLSFLQEIIAPRLARVESSRFLRFLLIVGFVMTAIIAVGTVLVWLLSEPLLAILGPDYRGLTVELVVTMIGAGLMTAAMAWGFINQSRHWVEGAWTAIPLSLLWFVVGYLTLDLKTVFGAATMLASQAIPLLLVELYRTVLGLRTWKREATSRTAAENLEAHA